MRLKTAVTALVACLALAVPSAALAASPTQDAYGGTAGQQEGGGNTPSSTSPGSETAGTSPEAVAVAATTESSGTLPFTGLEVGLIALAGVALLGGGVVLYRVSRRGFGLSS